MTVLHVLYQHASLLSNSVALLVVAMYYFFAIIGMEAFRYQVYPQCWYGYIHMHMQLQYRQQCNWYKFSIHTMCAEDEKRLSLMTEN